MAEGALIKVAEGIIGQLGNLALKENDKKVIMDYLLDSNIEENVSILPIVGIGGLGKTTLAQLVFNEKKMQKHFDKKLWLFVSNDFDVKIIVEKILESAKGKKPENLEMNTLINDRQKELMERDIYLY